MKTNEFRKRVLPLKDHLLRMAYRITGDAEQSEKIVEDVMLAVWADRASLVVIQDLPIYCLMKVRNCALQTRRGRPMEKEPFAVG